MRPFWVASTDFDLLWHAYENEFIVYHTGSTDTHLLTPLAGWIIRSLQNNPQSIESLYNQIENSTISCPDISLKSLESILLQLEELSLVERCQC